MMSWLRRRASRRLSAEAARDRALRARDEMDARGRPAAPARGESWVRTARLLVAQLEDAGEPVPAQLRELAGWGKPGLRRV
jgi:hypothetical protein